MASIRKTYPFFSCSDSASQECSICLDDYKNVSYVDPCLHKFCFTCIVQWSEVNSKCPICRTEFTNILHNVRNDKDFDSMLVTQSNHESRQTLAEDEDEFSNSDLDWADADDVWETPTSDVEEFLDSDDFETDNLISISSNSSENLFEDYNSDINHDETITVDIYNLEFRRIMETAGNEYSFPSEPTVDFAEDFNSTAVRQTQTPLWSPDSDHVFYPIHSSDSPLASPLDIPSTAGSTSSVMGVDWTNTDIISVPSRTGSTVTLTSSSSRKRSPELSTDNKNIKHLRQSAHF